MTDRDLLEIFDAALPRLAPYGPRSVPEAGAREAAEHARKRGEQRTELAIFTGATGIFGAMAWLLTGPWVPLWFLIAITSPAVLSSFAAARAFLRLTFGPRLQQALPSGTDAASAQLEDGAWSRIRDWNGDALAWNRQVEALRLEVSGWQLLHRVPEARDIEWSEHGSRVQAEGLIAAMRGLMADRAALVARKDEIDRMVDGLGERLLRLEASDALPVAALPAPGTDDPPDDG